MTLVNAQDFPNASLSDREKEILRLLAKSHDAKSSARVLGLSVHTVNEYLRSSRRKLGVSSSREAARRFAEHEASLPKYAVDREIGVASAAAGDRDHTRRAERTYTVRQLAFAIGGTFVMTLVIAVAALAWFSSKPAVTGPLSNWSTTTSVPSSKTLVRNRIVLDGRRLVWNGSPISEQQARQYLDITKEMSPQPLLVFSASPTTSEEAKQRTRALIDEVLNCTPSLCVEVVAPATHLGARP